MERQDWRSGRLRSRAVRLSVLAVALAGTFVAGSASAAAATYYVTQGGSGTDCTLGDPCGSVDAALTAHRSDPQPDDVIDVGPGTFVGNVEADAPEDSGLTIQGTTSGGTLQTTLRGEDAGGITGAAVGLGLCAAAPVTLRDAMVDTVGAESFVSAVELEGRSGIVNVHAANDVGSDALSVVEICGRGSRIRDSEIDATGTDATTGIFSLAGFTLARSVVRLDSGSGNGIVRLSAYGTAPPLRLRRSWIDSDLGNPNAVIQSQGDVELDSSLVTGGAAGLVYDNSSGDGGAWQIQNSTIDVGAAGEYDSALPDILLPTDDGDPRIDVAVDSSILAEEIQTSPGSDGPGSVTCTYSDVQLVLIDPPVSDDCDISPGNPQGNTTTDPADQFVGGSPFDWSLKASAPAIDTGQPGAIPAELARKDLAGNARRAAGSPAACPFGTRDKGAYEFIGPPCELSPPQITGGANPTPGTELDSTPGEFSNKPTKYSRLWLRCDELGGNCDAMDPARTKRFYTVRAADVGHTLRLQVTASNAAGSSEPALSDPTGVVTE